MEAVPGELKKARKKRINGKAALTRIGKVINMQIVGNRSNEEIQKTLDNYEEVHSELEAKHEEVTMLIKDEAQFEEEERWIEQCQETFLRLKIDAQDYMEQQPLNNNIKTGSTSKPAENSPPEAQGSDTETPAAEENDVKSVGTLEHLSAPSPPPPRSMLKIEQKVVCASFQFQH